MQHDQSRKVYCFRTQKQRPEPSQTRSYMEEGVTQLHPTHTHTVTPPDFSDTPEPVQEAPHEHSRRSRSRIERVTRFLSRRDKEKQKQ